jgi:phage gpG-like protein
LKFTAKVTRKLKKLDKLSSFGGNLKELERQTNALIALEIRNAAIKLINENTDGTPAIRYNPRRKVAVSKPGDPPNTDLGRLVQSIRVERGEGTAALVGTNLKYGAWLEFGTQTMAPRPWLSTALKMTSANLAKITRTAYDNFMKEFFK